MSSEYDKTKDWVHYLTRPFNLFGASVWHEWYLSEDLKNLIGIHMPTALFIEETPATVRNYRSASELVDFKEAIRKIVVDDPQRMREILLEGEDLNKQAMAILAAPTSSFSSLEDAVVFLRRLALRATVIPYWVPQWVTLDNDKHELLPLAEKLRGISHYPDLVQKVIEPLAIKELMNGEIKDPEASFALLTYKEILTKSFSTLVERRLHRDNGKKFIYQSLSGEESVSFLLDTDVLIASLEKTDFNGTDGIKGAVGYMGKVRGVARVVRGRYESSILFNEGDILVSINSNPSFMPLIQKAAAIVTDEGGITCHAVIVSRELKKPCVVGTKNATRVLKDGDMIEVDATKGVVTIIK